jgi:hypothetical protein
VTDFQVKTADTDINVRKRKHADRRKTSWKCIDMTLDEPGHAVIVEGRFQIRLAVSEERCKSLVHGARDLEPPVTLFKQPPTPIQAECAAGMRSFADQVFREMDLRLKWSEPECLSKKEMAPTVKVEAIN